MQSDVVLPSDRSTTLCFYSGGLDSTGLLYKLLVIDDEPGVHVHHISLINRQNRHVAEQLAVNAVLDYFKTRLGKSFTYSCSSIEYPTFNGNAVSDHDLFVMMASGISNAAWVLKRVVYGLTKTDAREGTQERLERNRKIFYAAARGGFTREFPIQHLTKREIWDMLPADLRALTWSCRYPTYVDGKPVKCGTCTPCVEIASFRT